MYYPDWTPWGAPRLSKRGLETVYHHPLVAVISSLNLPVQVVNPASFDPDGMEGQCFWRPMIWAERGRKEWNSYSKLGYETAFEADLEHLYHTIDCVCEQLFEPGSVDPRCIEAWIKLIENRIEWCRDRGIVYRHLVIPEHHSIYSDLIRDRPALSDQRPIASISRGMVGESKSAIIYPLSAMVKGRNTHETSMAHDVHFTGYGCYLCYKALVESLSFISSADIVKYNELEEREIFVGGDVARAINKSGRKIHYHFPPNIKHEYLIKGVSFAQNQVDVIHTNNTNGRKLVLFRTSNSTHLIPYLFKHFSRIVAVANLKLFNDLIENENPDVVVSEMPERYFAHSISSYDTNYSQNFITDSTNFTDETSLPLPLPK